MFSKGVETGFLKFHPPAMGPESKATAGLEFLNIIAAVSLSIDFDVCERPARNKLQMINRLKTRQLWLDEQ
jgi:hypothetical protein